MEKYEKNRMLFRRGELVKSVLLGLLVVSLIALVAVYISGTKVYEAATAGDGIGKSFDKLWSALGGVEPKGLDSERLLPEFIGYKQTVNKEPLGCVADGQAGSELYGIIKPCLIELFGSSSVCRALTPSAGERQFNQAAEGEEFVYLRYHEPVLYQMIYAYAAEKLTVSQSDVAAGTDGNVGAYISELIIVPDKDFAAHRFVAYAHDGEGNYYEFRPGDYVVSSEFYISKLADRGTSAVNVFRFSKEYGFDLAVPLVDCELETDIIVSESVDARNGAVRDELLRLFGYNPDKLDGFADEAEGAYVYIDSHSRLKLGDGVISFLTSDAYDTGGDDVRGVRVDTLLGYSIDGTPTLFDKLTATDNLIARLSGISSELTGGEAQLCLGDVYSDGVFLVIEYILTYDNVRIGDEAYIRAVLTEDAVSRLEMQPVSVKITAGTSLVPAPDYVLKKLLLVNGELAADSIGDIYLRYVDGKAQWAARLAE